MKKYLFMEVYHKIMTDKINVLSSKDLILAIEKIIVCSGFTIKQFEFKKNGFSAFTISQDNEQIELSINIGNIGSSYLPNKPYILRRQVRKMTFEEIPDNKRNEISMLIGITKISDKFIIACWNPFYFIGHSTNRSCYILNDSLMIAYLKGIYDGIDCKTPVLACSEENFGKLLKIYIGRYAVD